ncbi:MULTISPECIES: hypothetical protein [unclassified Mesorhizobium]|uniref:hypothetical protein n=1 Tax=unclassified Mesorhizobium TaxID=325217 RepID=UPI0019D472CA|nr:hypothetical protein [Mesorhizobium sp. M7A.F.Ca.US.010.02.1.1]
MASVSVAASRALGSRTNPSEGFQCSARIIQEDFPASSSRVREPIEELAKRPEVRFRTRSYETVRSAVASGFGMAVLNMRPIGRATADGEEIVRRPILDELPPPTLIVADMNNRVGMIQAHSNVDWL